MDRYTVFKQTGTHADVLAAVGAGDVLRHLEPRIVELEDRFEIQFRRPLLPSDLNAIDPGFSFLVLPNKKAPSLPPERIFRARAAMATENGANPGPAVTENRMYSILGRMKAYAGPNKVVARFSKTRREVWTEKLWNCFQGDTSFIFSSPLVQLFNPHAARGYALTKPTGTNRSDRTKDRWAEPFVEWLRYRGYFEGAAGWFTSHDLRLFCPVPADVPYGQLAGIVSAFRDLRLGGTAVKMDCRAVLGLTRLLIEKAEAHRRPRRSIRGVWITHYKDMGQAHTLMAMDQLAIPDWFELRTSQQAQCWLQTLEEHDVVLRRLTDNHSDEFALLKQYRRTLQARWQESVGEFVEFLAGYGMLLFKRRAQNHWLLPQFTTSGVTPILRRDPVLRMILRNPGFLAVAAAVRSSTFGAQAARHNGRTDQRETQYGLLSEIRRAGSSGRHELMVTVASFVSDFNREATRRRASGLRAAQIQDGEIEAFAHLLERLPSHVPAGSLLGGFASCLRTDNAPVDAEPEMAEAIPA